MPVLAAEPAVFPESLFESPGAFLTPGRRWYVMYTQPRQEKSLARDLCSAGVPFYLALMMRRRRLRGRMITSHVPLFPSYLSVFADHDEWCKALATGRIVRPLSVSDQAGFWKDLRQIQKLIVSGAPITPEDRLAPGKRVAIRNGPLAGMEGVIYRASSGRRFQVQVDFIQRGASVLLDDVDVTALN